MKANVIMLLGMFLLASSCQQKVDVQKEEKAIKAVIEEELNAYVNKDLKRIGDTWAQKPTSIKLFMHGNGAVQLTGWDKIYESDKKSIETSTSDRTKYDIQFTDYQFNINGNNAWVLLNATWNVPQEDSVLRLEQKRVLAFEKSGGKWKYTLMAICKTSNK